MRYSIEVETAFGDVLSFPNYYGTVEGNLAMRIARDQSRTSPAASVRDAADGRVVVRYVCGLSQGITDPLWEGERRDRAHSWDDEDYYEDGWP